MYIFLIIWFIFLFAYFVFNVYGISRVMAMRIKNDVVPLAVMIYLLVIFIIIAFAIYLISTFSWGGSIRLFTIMR